MNEGMARPLLTLTLYEGEWSVSHTGRFILWERALGTHWIGGWLGTSAGLDPVENRKISCTYRESKPGRLARSPSLHRLSYPVSLASKRSEIAVRSLINKIRDTNTKKWHSF
jgi:hypothetical protein